MARKGTLLFLLVALAVAVSAQSNFYIGYARLIGGTNDNGVVGDAYFITNTTSLTVTVWINITGVTQNPTLDHGIHVHEYGDISDRTFGNAGSHYIGQGNSVHGCESDVIRHEGDMGNWPISGGAVTLTKLIDLLALTGDYSIIGKSVVLHNFTDNCINITSAGGRLAAGVIGVANLGNLPQEVVTLSGYAGSGNSSATSGVSTLTKAVAVLTPISGYTVSGIVIFTQTGTSVTVQANITGLPNVTAAYGFHIHEFGDLRSPNGTSSGNHFNPFNSPHAFPPNATRHVGDMGNICSFDASGNAYYSYTFTDLMSLTNNYNIMGLTVVVHALRDVGAQTGYGTRIAQGIIGIAHPSTTVTLAPGLTISDPVCAPPSASTTTTISTSTATPVTTTSGSPVITTSGASSVAASFIALVVVLIASLL